MTTSVSSATDTYALVIDDCTTVRGALVAIFESRKLVASCVSCDREAREWLSANGVPQIVILDLDLGEGGRGEDFLGWFRTTYPNVPVVILTGDVRVESCVRAMREGAYHYLCKPFKMRELLKIVNEAVRKSSASVPAPQPTTAARPCSRFSYLGADHVERLAASVSPILIHGETGTGKEFLARALHEIGPRAELPFTTLKCRMSTEKALQEDLFLPLRTLLGGGPTHGRGTVLLDEVADLPAEAQGRLIRMLEDPQRAAGFSGQKDAGIRVISTTVQHLEDEVKKGRFRADLFYRLSVLSVHIPPLRERRHDLPQLTQELLAEICSVNRRAVPTLTARAWDLLQQYAFPGNIRQLRNALDYALTLTSGSELDINDFPPSLRHEPRPRRTPLDSAERERLMELIEKHHGSNKRVAEEMGVDPATVWRLKKKHGLLKVE